MPEDDARGRRIRQSWDENAAAWVETVRTGAIDSRRLGTDETIVRAVLAHHPRQVLDLGCGEGWLVRRLSAAGVKAVGVDGSASLIDSANRGGGRFLCAGYDQIVAEPERCGTSFDVIVANFALLEEDLAPLLAALPRISTGEGRLLIQTPHPVAVGGPYADGWREEDFCGFAAGPWMPMPWYFRTLGSWVALLRDNGFHLDRLSEPPHPTEPRPLSLLLDARVEAG